MKGVDVFFAYFEGAFEVEKCYSKHKMPVRALRLVRNFYLLFIRSLFKTQNARQGIKTENGDYIHVNSEYIQNTKCPSGH